MYFPFVLIFIQVWVIRWCSLPLQLETNEGVAGTLAAIELHGLGLDYLQRLPEQINSLTRVDIRSAAARLIDSKKYVLAGAGPE